MRRAALLALMIILTLLSGCAPAGVGEEQFKENRKKLNASEEISFTADMSADMGDKLFECTLGCVRSGEETEITVVQPEIASGVRARLKNGETTLEYDGVELVVGSVCASGLSPISAMPLITDAILSGHAVRLYAEQGEAAALLAAQTYIDEESYALVWYTLPELLPVHAEIVYSCKAVISCDIKDFTYR